MDRIEAQGNAEESNRSNPMHANGWDSTVAEWMGIQRQHGMAKERTTGKAGDGIGSMAAQAIATHGMR